MSFTNKSPLPKEVVIIAHALTATPYVPTTVRTDVGRVSVSVTDGGSHTFTLTDGNDVPLGNLKDVSIDPGIPASFEFDPPIRAEGGIKLSSDAAGVKVDLFGWTLGGFTLVLTPA